MSSNEKIIQKALKIMEASFKEGTEKLNASRRVKDYARLQIANEPEEVMCVLFLDNQYRLLAFERMFRGSINEANVYARPIMRKVFEYNAAKIILAHNHPSGSVTPSDADIILTKSLKNLFAQIDCPVVDHIIVTAKECLSLDEEGLM